MKLASASHAQLQSFLRYHLNDETLIVPTISIYKGNFTRIVTRLLKISAITFGRCILVSPAVVRRVDDQRLVVPGWLVAREAMHVLQYGQTGFLRFFVSYLQGYLRALCAQKGVGSAARMNAYLAIEEEREARWAERSYEDWCHASPLKINDE